MGLGKWIAGAIGWAAFGPLGGVLGFLLGSALDSAADRSDRGIGDGDDGTGYGGGNYGGNGNGGGGYGDGNYRDYNGESYRTIRNSFDPEQQRNSFMVAMLVLSTSVMKADGKVLRSELDYVKDFIRNNFGEGAIPQSLHIIKELLHKEINVPEICGQVKVYMAPAQRLQLFHYLVGIAQADGCVSQPEIALLRNIATFLGILKKDADSILEMYAPAYDPYKVLEIEHTATDEQVKSAFKKMALKFHPDKVENLGEDVKKAAEEKFKMIVGAYDQIKRERGIN